MRNNERAMRARRGKYTTAVERGANITPVLLLLPVFVLVLLRHTPDEYEDERPIMHALGPVS